MVSAPLGNVACKEWAARRSGNASRPAIMQCRLLRRTVRWKLKFHLTVLLMQHLCNYPNVTNPT